MGEYENIPRKINNYWNTSGSFKNPINMRSLSFYRRKIGYVDEVRVGWDTSSCPARFKKSVEGMSSSAWAINVLMHWNSVISYRQSSSRPRLRGDLKLTCCKSEVDATRWQRWSLRRLMKHQSSSNRWWKNTTLRISMLAMRTWGN